MDLMSLTALFSPGDFAAIGYSMAGIAVLLFAWAGPLPHLVPGSFAAHMWLHMLVVGIAVPLIASAVAKKLKEVAKRMCATLVDNMQRRLAKVVEMGGERTGY